MTQDVDGGDTRATVTEESAIGTVDDFQNSRGTKDGLSSLDVQDDYAPRSPPGLPNPPRPLVFGSISPEYLKTMWEEEGPGALTNTGVWAAKVREPFHPSLSRLAEGGLFSGPYHVCGAVLVLRVG